VKEGLRGGGFLGCRVRAIHAASLDILENHGILCDSTGGAPPIRKRIVEATRMAGYPAVVDWAVRGSQVVRLLRPIARWTLS
jgi:hypothetical protein